MPATGQERPIGGLSGSGRSALTSPSSGHSPNTQRAVWHDRSWNGAGIADQRGPRERLSPSHTPGEADVGVAIWVVIARFACPRARAPRTRPRDSVNAETLTGVRLQSSVNRNGVSNSAPWRWVEEQTASRALGALGRPRRAVPRCRAPPRQRTSRSVCLNDSPSLQSRSAFPISRASSRRQRRRSIGISRHSLATPSCGRTR